MFQFLTNQMYMCIHMCMLTKRANILFEEKTWQELTRRAKKQKASVGELVRSAVEEKYPGERELEARKKALDHIRQIRPKPVKGKIDYKALINAGRIVY